MIGFPEAPRAWGLTRGMARMLGLSLPQAVVEGWLSREELAALVRACDRCASQGSCDRLLSQPGPAAGVPGFCPNKPGLEALAPL
ncbi:DUF6455 family protein [Rhodobacter sp.]